MNSHNINKLTTRYPSVYKDVEFECGDGWFPILDSLGGIIQSEVSAKQIEYFHVDQIKEKFGGLRFYCIGANDRVKGAIEMAEVMSTFVCEHCGNHGILRHDRLWFKTYCDPCNIEYPT